MTTHLLDTLEDVADLLDDFDWDWALVGGLAVSAYVEPRFTRDIDIVVSVSNDAEAEEFVRAWRSNGFEIASVVEQESTGRLATVRTHRPGAQHRVVVDILFASSGIEPEIAAEARHLELAPDLELPIARPGHLVALKLLATDDESRPQDETDLNALLDVLDEDETRAARRALDAIESRGYHRDRNLHEMLRSYLSD